MFFNSPYSEVRFVQVNYRFMMLAAMGSKSCRDNRSIPAMETVFASAFIPGCEHDGPSSSSSGIGLVVLAAIVLKAVKAALGPPRLLKNPFFPIGLADSSGYVPTWQPLAQLPSWQPIAAPFQGSFWPPRSVFQPISNKRLRTAFMRSVS